MRLVFGLCYVYDIDEARIGFRMILKPDVNPMLPSRARERQTDRQTDRQTERERERERDREREREREIDCLVAHLHMQYIYIYLCTSEHSCKYIYIPPY